MTSPNLADLAVGLKRANRITAADVSGLRRAVFGDMKATHAEAETLVALDEVVADRAPEWLLFYVEALTDLVARQQVPAGYVSDADADWLISMLSRDGAIRGDSELEALVRILEAATEVPARLGAYALEQVKLAVLADGFVAADEVGLLRRILYATAGQGNIAITRAEAEVLFDINDAVRGRQNDPSWPDLFSKALAACVMTVSGYRAPSREEAAHREAWLEKPHQRMGVGAFVASMFEARKAFSSVASIKAGLKPADPIGDDVRSDEAARKGAEPISADEAAWLVSRIRRDGSFDESERKLVAFIKAESPDIHPALKPLLDEIEAKRA